MRWLQSISFSSLSTSPRKDKSNGNHKKQRYSFGFRNGLSTLIWPKELRHLRQYQEVAPTKEVNIAPLRSSYHTPSSSPTKALSSALAVPLPLPLPGDAKQRLEDLNSSRLGYRGSWKTTDHVETRSSPKLLHQEMIIGDSFEGDFRANVRIRSAPGSPLSSHAVLSPPRKITSDIFQNYMYPTDNQAWSAPEMPTGLPPSAFTSYIFQNYMYPTDNQAWSAPEMPTGLPPLAFYDYGAYSTDNTPFHSPDRMNISPTSLIRRRKASLDTSLTGLESNSPFNVHPLPLPPGAAMVSTSASVPQFTTNPDPLPMNSQWQKGKLIGRGTFGSVYVASNRETGALCAMKEVDIFPDDPKSAESIKQLEQEIKVLSHLKHPNIVQYYGSEIAEDKFYIYLEYVHPGSINKYVRDHCGAITESVIRNFTRHILSGLAYLHGTKTIHRDIKGANLLVDASGVVKLADFGMSKHLSGQRADLSLKGSPYWMAPELMQAVMQKDNRSELALAVDIWSLGCTIIEMYTGKAPWSEYEGAAAMFKVMRDTPPTPETLSPEGKDFLRCCFQRNPAERPSASTLLEHRFIKSSNSSRVCHHLTDNVHGK